MKAEDLKKLSVGDRVKWRSSGEKGTVSSIRTDTVAIKWDDEDEEYLYDPNEFRFGLVHVEVLV